MDEEENFEKDLVEEEEKSFQPNEVILNESLDILRISLGKNAI